METLDARVAALESIVRNRELTLKEHKDLLSDYSIKLSSLTNSVAELTKTVTLMHAEMREGFQLHHRYRERGKDKEETEPETEFIVTGDGNEEDGLKQDKEEIETEGSPEGEISHQNGFPKPYLEDNRLTAKGMVLSPFCREDSYSRVSRDEVNFAEEGTPPELQIQLSQICMKGESWHWVKMLKEKDPCLEWEKLKRVFFDSLRWLLKQEVPKISKSLNRQWRKKSIKTKDEIRHRSGGDNVLEREYYVVSAGFALGFVAMARGDDAFDFMDTFIMDGTIVNIDVTALGATVALALMFLKTRSEAIVARLSIPNTRFDLQYVRPDFIMLHVIARNLIMWSRVHPSKDWVLSQIPEIIRNGVEGLGDETNDIDDMHTEAFIQVYVNIVAGACISLGLVFAGTKDGNVQELLYEIAMCFLNEIKPVSFKSENAFPKGMSHYIDRGTLETCLHLIILSLSVVMAGSGHLLTFRLLRFLRSRNCADGQSSYGSQISVSLAMGFLFLGGGMRTFSTSNSSIAALLVTLFPPLPAGPNDNRCHLQAFRLLYVLVTEARWIHTVDVDNGLPFYAPLEVTIRETEHYAESSFCEVTPCLIPERATLKSIRVCGPRYWPQVIDFAPEDKPWWNFEDKNNPFNSGVLYIKRKVRAYSYVDDPIGCQSLLSRAMHKVFGLTNIRESDPIFEEIKSVASYALGNIAVSNLAKYLPFILDHIDNQQKKQYLLLHSMKEVIVRQVVDKAEFQESSVHKILNLFFNHCDSDEEGVRNVVAECLGKIALIEPTKLVPALKDNDRHVRWAAVLALSILFTINQTSSRGFFLICCLSFMIKQLLRKVTNGVIQEMSEKAHRKGKQMVEWLIHWKNQPEEEATWEKAAGIQVQFPSLCLEDKANLSGGGIDRNLTQNEVNIQERPKMELGSKRGPSAEGLLWKEAGRLSELA